MTLLETLEKVGKDLSITPIKRLKGSRYRRVLVRNVRVGQVTAAGPDVNPRHVTNISREVHSIHV
jgi:hypothetical protein